jgi:hypothetical protein
MRSSQWRQTAREAVNLLALGIALVVAIAAVRSERNLHRTVKQLEPGAQRAYVHDRLVGTRIDLDQLTERLSGETSLPGLAITWILDLEACADCFNNIGGWSRLERLTDYELVLFLLGEPSGRVQGQLASLTRTDVRNISRDQLVATLGYVLPSTKLLLNADGFILLVDSRSTAQDCAWSFEAQLGAIEGVVNANAIRGGFDVTHSSVHQRGDP